MKGQKLGLRHIFLVIGLGLLALMVMDFNSRMAELRRLTNEKQVISAQATAQMQTQESLEGQIAFATSDAAVREWAYEDAKMTRDGEYPVVPIGVDATPPSPTPTPTPTQVELTNWESWKLLFLGKKPAP